MAKTGTAIDANLRERIEAAHARWHSLDGERAGSSVSAEGWRQLGESLSLVRQATESAIAEKEQLIAAHRDREETFKRSASEHIQVETELRESQRFIAAILGAMTTQVAVLDVEGNIIAVNTAWERYASSERPGEPGIGLGKNYLAACEAAAGEGRAQGQEVAAAIRDLLAGERRVFTAEIPDRSDGKRRWFILRITPFEGAGPKRLVVAKEEITERKEAEEALRQSMRRTELILDSAVDGVVIIDESGRIEMANPAAEQIFGYPLGEMLGHNIRMLMPEPYQREHDRYLRNYLETGEKKIIGIGREVMGLRKHGSVFPMDLAVSEVFHDGKRSFMGTVRDITERKEMEAAVRSERDFAESLVETAQVIVLVLDTAGRIIRFNRYFEEVSGYRLGEVRGAPWIETFLPERDHARIRELFTRAVGGIPTRGNINPIVTKSGEERQIEWYDKTLTDADAAVTGILVVGQDISERLRLEEQFRQAQKMEAIGRLAGGVAHDFNTLLGSITGYGEMLLGRLNDESALRRPVEQICRGAERGAALTRQLLAFSRRQVLQPKVVALNAVVTEMKDMLERLVGEDVRVVLELDPELGRIRVDSSQLEQVVMNLVVNASDAMPRGGRIVLHTGNVDIGEDHPHRGNVLMVGPYVMLAVSDSGCGIDEATQKHIFEPFFTTKEVGKGTGLGLSTVYGIVRQSGGGIAVESRIEEGTTVWVYLLRVEDEIKVDEARPALSHPEHGSETVLLVEDDEMFLGLLSEVLESNGYEVLAAGEPAEALDISEGRDGTIDLVLSDMVMPGMSGKELADRLVVERPGLRILLMSGYTDEALEDRGITSEGGFIQKPFSTKDLMRKVREILDGR